MFMNTQSRTTHQPTGIEATKLISQTPKTLDDIDLVFFILVQVMATRMRIPM